MGMTTTLPASINLATIGGTESGTGVIVANSGTTTFNFDNTVVSVTLSVGGNADTISPGFEFVNFGWDVAVDGITVTAVGNGTTTLEIVSGNPSVTPTVSIQITVSQVQVIVAEQSLQDIADSIRTKLGAADTYLPSEMSAAIDSISGGGGGSTDNNWAEVMRHESTQLYDNEITDLAEYQLGTGTLTGNWITSISFPELTTAGENAFRQQTSVASMNLPRLATLGSSSVCYRMAALQSIALPSLSTPTRIDLKNTFQLCSALTKVDLGSNSFTFGYRLYAAVFASCSALTTLIIRCPEVVDMYNNASNIFSGTPLISGTGYIYVPSSLVNSYKGAASTKWGAFSSQIRAIEDYSSDGTVNGDINV